MKKKLPVSNGKASNSKKSLPKVVVEKITKVPAEKKPQIINLTKKTKESSGDQIAQVLEKKDSVPIPKIETKDIPVATPQTVPELNLEQLPTDDDFETKIYKSLSELGIIEAKRLTSSFEESKKKNISFQEILLNNDLISDEDLGKTIAELLDLPFINLSTVKIDSSLTHLIPDFYAKTHGIIAFEETGSEIRIATNKPGNFSSVQKFVEIKAQKKSVLHYCTQRDFEKALKIYKQNLQVSYDKLLKEQMQDAEKNKNSEAPIEKIVDLLIEYAYDNGASDIHIEPSKEGSVVRFRIDGVMQEVLSFSQEVDKQVISRIKFLSKLRTDEHLSAQDGKIRLGLENEDLDIRVSLVPIEHGEKCVMRLLSARYRQFGLDTLGMNPTDLSKVLQESKKPYGMILSTGPTGSGKSTTMYSILKILNTKERNIETIEDPIEYELKGINQIQVNPKTNLTFAEGLRSILRQDPNIIYVGEIRDEETADIAVNSAMTGHLVLSTLHTNNAATALPRLLDMGIEPYLAASTVNIIIAQRLIRKICDKCKVSQTKKIVELEKHFDKKIIQKYFDNSTEARIYFGKGCPVCRNSGYSGRIGIFEILLISDPIKDLIVSKSDSQKIMEQALLEGMTTMMEDGLSKIQQGLTTTEEVVRATIE